MAFTYIDEAEADTLIAGSSLLASSTLDILAGDVIVAIARWVEDVTPGTFDIVDGEGFEELAELSHGGYGRMGYLIATGDDPGATIRLNTGGSASGRYMVVMQWRPTGIASLGLSGLDNPGADTSVESDQFSPDAGLIIGGVSGNAGYVFSAPKVGGVAADGSIFCTTSHNFAGLWYQIAGSGQTDIVCECTIATASDWHAEAITFLDSGGSSSARYRSTLAIFISIIFGGYKWR